MMTFEEVTWIKVNTTLKKDTTMDAKALGHRVFVQAKNFGAILQLGESKQMTQNEAWSEKWEMRLHGTLHVIFY